MVFGSGGALFFATYSGAMENSLTDHFLFVGVQHSVPKYVVIGMETLVLSSRRHAWFAHVVPNRRVSFRVSRYPSCILLTCVFVRSGAFFGIDVGSWTFLAHGRTVSAAGKHGRREREREAAESALPKHKFSHDT